MDVTEEFLPVQGRAEQLILLFHAHGAAAAAMRPLALKLRAAFPQAAVLAPQAPALPGAPRCWYAPAAGGAGELAAAAPAIDAALPAQHAWVQAQQQRLGVGAAATALAGVSEGAVLALALALAQDGLAGRVLAFGGGLSRPPQAAPRLTTLHFFHGEDDAVIPAAASRQALDSLAELQGDATLDLAGGVGAGLHPALLQCALQRLQTHIPLRTWQAALGAAPGPTH